MAWQFRQGAPEVADEPRLSTYRYPRVILKALGLFFSGICRAHLLDFQEPPIEGSILPLHAADL